MGVTPIGSLVVVVDCSKSLWCILPAMCDLYCSRSFRLAPASDHDARIDSMHKIKLVTEMLQDHVKGFNPLEIHVVFNVF